MTGTAGFSFQQYQFHLNLYNNYYAVLEKESDDTSKLNVSSSSSAAPKNSESLVNNNMAIPKTFKVKSKNLQYHSGEALKRKWMKRKKRITTEGKRVQEAEKEFAENSLLDASSVEELDQRRRVHDNYKSTLREFYYSKASIKRKRRVELLKRKAYGTVCSNERRYVSGGVNKESHPLLFVGDRGYGVGSAIKGHLKYGGQWKPRKHSLYTSVCITNERNTSQTCTYCFGKLTRPIRRIEENGKLYLKSVNGAVVRNNKNCMLSKKSNTHKGRDATYAMAIGISGLTWLIFGRPLSVFDYQRSSQSTTGESICSSSRTC